MLIHIMPWFFLTTDPGLSVLDSILNLSGLGAFLHPPSTSVSHLFRLAVRGEGRAMDEGYLPADSWLCG